MDVRAQMRVAAVVCFVAAGGTLVAAGVRKVAARRGFRPETRATAPGGTTATETAGLLARGETSSAWKWVTRKSTREGDHVEGVVRGEAARRPL